MRDKMSRWLFYTVFIGALPMFIRFFAWGLSDTPNVVFLSAAELVFFGLVLHISCLTEMEISNVPSCFRAIHTRIALTAVIFYSVLYAFSILPDMMSAVRTTVCALLAAVSSFFWCRYFICLIEEEDLQ
jgi:hypothetical protein